MKITDARLKDLKVGNRISENGGLSAEKLQKGRCVFRLQKRISRKDEPSRTFRLGYWPDISIQEARERASTYRKLCDDGIDPRASEEKAKEQEKVQDELHKVTLRDAFDHEYDALLKLDKISQKTRNQYHYVITAVSPDWWDISIRSITEEMVQDQFDNYVEQTGKEPQAKSWKGLLDRLFKACRLWKIGKEPVLLSNPMDVLAKISTATNERQGFLFSDEITKVIDTYWHHTSQGTYQKNYPFIYPLSEEERHNALFLMVFTGLRKEEILQIRWKDYFPSGALLYDERVERPLLRVYILKGRTKAQRLHFIPVTKTIESIFDRQRLVRSTFLSERREDRRAKWEDNEYVFFSTTDFGKKIWNCDSAVKRWRKYIGEERIWKKLEDNAAPNVKVIKDINERFSCHWTRHSFTTICKEHLGYSDEAINKANGRSQSRTSSIGTYIHEDAVEIAEDSRELFERLHAYLNTESFLNKAVRGYFKKSIGQEVDLSDPTAPPDDFYEEEIRLSEEEINQRKRGIWMDLRLKKLSDS